LKGHNPRNEGSLPGVVREWTPILRRRPMKRFVVAAALLCAAAPVETAPEGTYTVQVTVSGMS